MGNQCEDKDEPSLPPTYSGLDKRVGLIGKVTTFYIYQDNESGASFYVALDKNFEQVYKSKMFSGGFHEAYQNLLANYDRITSAILLARNPATYSTRLQ